MRGRAKDTLGVTVRPHRIEVLIAVHFCGDSPNTNRPMNARISGLVPAPVPVPAKSGRRSQGDAEFPERPRHRGIEQKRHKAGQAECRPEASPSVGSTNQKVDCDSAATASVSEVSRQSQMKARIEMSGSDKITAPMAGLRLAASDAAAITTPDSKALVRRRT